MALFVCFVSHYVAVAIELLFMIVISYDLDDEATNFPTPPTISLLGQGFELVFILYQ